MLTHSSDSSIGSRDRASGRLKAVAIALAVTVGLTSGVLSASAGTDSSGRSNSPTAHATRLRFGVKFSPFTVIDVPPRATHPGDYQPGDYTVFSDVLTDRTGRRVGTEGGSGLITKVSNSEVQLCYTLAIRLRGGQIAVQGLASPAPDKRLAVVGGTNRFLGARGHFHLVEHRNGTGVLVITLRH
jgi:hypothetical protein